jgi:GNAT superfamily N-acetyltransferase
VRSPLVEGARELYESTQAEDERIPWEWLRRSVASRSRWQPGKRCSHLIVAADARGLAAGRPLGFATGSFVPGYGGYVSYLGVDPRARARGIGTRLFRHLFQVLRTDADAAAEPLPFVVWESRPPAANAAPADRANWRARLRLFDRVGAWAVQGLNFLSPNYLRPDEPPVGLRLFVCPFDTPASAFDADALRRVAAGLYAGIYGEGPGSVVYDRALTPDRRPSLRPAADEEPEAVVC